MNVMILLGVTGGVVVAVFVMLYNGLINLRNDCDKAWSNIDVLLRQRYDEIPNLVEVCKGYIRHERETLTRVVEARKAGLAAHSPLEADQAHGRASSATADLFLVAEGYPDLKANEQFLRLQKRITGLESEIADRREYFNNCVNNYNTRIAQLPDVMVARLLGFGPRPLLRFRPADLEMKRRAA